MTLTISSVLLLIAAIMMFVSAFSVPVKVNLFQFAWGLVVLSLLFP
jgi:hypothetical protein